MEIEFMTIEDIDITGKKVLLRGDFNVPLDKNTNQITDDKRLIAAIPTIKYLIKNNAKVIACSHLGRPKGIFNKNLSLKVVADRFSEILENKVFFVDDCIGEKVKDRVEKLKDGEMLILENLRFYQEEKKDDDLFSKKLASLADIYVNDAFGTAHRKHSSTYGVAKYFRDRKLAVAGFLMKKEILYLSKAMKHYTRPVVAILGGAKIFGKIELIENFSKFVDTILIGGAMAYTFLKSKGFNIGKSLLDNNSIEVARKIILEIGKEVKVNFILPCDHIITDEINKGSKTEVCKDIEIPDNKIGVDIGPLTIKIFSKAIEDAKTILWNGPMGIFEISKFSNGTKEIAEAVAVSTNNGALSVLGGGDTSAAVSLFGLEDKYSHISTGGGASLEYMSGNLLPAIDILNKK